MSPRSSLVMCRSADQGFTHWHLPGSFPWSQQAAGLSFWVPLGFLVSCRGSQMIPFTFSGRFISPGSKVDLSIMVSPSSLLLPLFNSAMPWVLPGSSRRLRDDQSKIDFGSLEFCCFFEPGFV